MRKWKKHKMIYLIQRIKQDLGRLSIKDNEKENLIVEIQQKIIELGTFCERFSDTEEIVKFLEIAAENCYRYAINRREKISYYIQENLDLSLERIEALDEEKNHILFLPYKASMWGALRSIYESVLKDQDWHVSVMPIPYISKGDKNIKHYEGYFFCNLDGFIYYENYHIEKIKPDVIIIHNPYDEFNKATTIIEKYYSSELVKYTDHLVYVPYDVVNFLNFNESMCFMPGIRNAWRIFVQSKEIKKLYSVWINKNKIIALGTPKLDFLFEETKVEIPDKWKSKLNDKKIILWNLHISRAINDVEITLNLIDILLNFFSKHMIVLLVRPHPLFIETLFNTSKKMYKKYLDLIEKYETCEHIIIDDTAEVERAILLSDAYMGDKGSLEIMFGLTGKPMFFIENDLYLNISEYCKDIYISNIDIVDDKIIVFFNKINIIAELNFNSGKLVPLMKLEIEKGIEEDLKYLGDSIKRYKNKIIITPSFSNFVRIIDLKDHFLIKKELPYQDNELYKYYHLKTTDSSLIFMQPIYYGYDILVMELETNNIRKICIDYAKLDEYNIVYEEELFGNGVICEGKIFLPIMSKPLLIEVDENETVVHIIKNVKNGFICCENKDFDFWMIQNGQEAKIIKWNYFSGKVETFQNFPDNFSNSGNAFRYIVKYDEWLWLIPADANMFIKINYINGDIKKICCDNTQVEQILLGNDFFNFCYMYDNYLYLLPFYSKFIVRISLQDEIFDIKELRVEEFILKEGLVDKSYNYLSKNNTMEMFVDIVQSNSDQYRNERKNYYEKMIDDITQNSGNKIWQYIRNNL